MVFQRIIRTFVDAQMLLAHIFSNDNYLIGNSYANGNKNSNLFIYEACEYKDSRYDLSA